MRRLAALLLAMGMLALPGPVAAHTPNQRISTTGEFWVDLRCDTDARRFSVAVYQYKGFRGQMLLLCGVVRRLSRWSMGDTGRTWTNRISSLAVVGYGANVCEVSLYGHSRYRGPFINAIGAEDELGFLDNRASSVGYQPCEAPS